jgi:multisubunit Na+/H+ antiporter MnhE subunit
MKSLTLWPLTVVCCAAVYALTLASADPIDFATGLVFGTAVTLLLRPFLHETAITGDLAAGPSLLRRAIWFSPFLLAVLRDVVTGTVEVARYSLGLRDADYQGIVTLPIGERTRLGVAVSAWATTLSPGTALVDVDWEAGQILLHVIDASDPDAVRAAHQRFYDRYQRHVFP